MTPTLSPGYKVVAMKLQEQMNHGDVQSRLSDALNDWHQGNNSYGGYIDHSGDGESGDVIYSQNGDTRKASYEIGMQGGKAVTHIDAENSLNVVPHTEYVEEADDDDHYASMQESFNAGNIYTDLPLYERFISKGERDSADEGSFAGKGKSFPILKPGDISAAIHAMGRAGSANYGMAQLKANIIRIAKAKGWTKQLPKTWRGDSTSEADRNKPSGLKLIESATTLETIILKEAKADYEIKLIAPGKGSSAFYPAEVLKRDGPKVFKAGTHVYLNHPTAAEESARPEGDVKNLAGVLTTQAAYHESHAKGPGLYARMKVFADHGQMVEEKAAHVGMSIRASGNAESGKAKDGLPILKELISAESVDVVTRAGAGGMILTEGLRPNSQEVEMTEAEVKALVESASKAAVEAALSQVQAPVKLLEARALRGDAMVEANKVLAPLALSEAAKAFIIENVTREAIPTKDGGVDVEKFGPLVMAEARRVAAIVGGGEKVVGLGTSIGLVENDPEKLRKEEKRRRKEAQAFQESEERIFAEITGLPIKEVA